MKKFFLLPVILISLVACGSGEAPSSLNNLGGSGTDTGDSGGGTDSSGSGSGTDTGGTTTDTGAGAGPDDSAIAGNDRDQDGVKDSYDDFPDDVNEFADFEQDGIADSVDTDNNNNQVLDSEELLIVFGVKSSYAINSSISFRVMGFRPDGSRMLDVIGIGWHVQYFIYNKAQPDTTISFIGSTSNYPDATFEPVKDYWLMEVPTPEATGDYHVDVTLDCSYSNRAECEIPFEPVTKRFDFSVL